MYVDTLGTGLSYLLVVKKYPATDSGNMNPFHVQILFGIPHEIGDRKNPVPVSTAYAMLFLAHTDY